MYVEGGGRLKRAVAIVMLVAALAAGRLALEALGRSTHLLPTVARRSPAPRPAVSPPISGKTQGAVEAPAGQQAPSWCQNGAPKTNLRLATDLHFPSFRATCLRAPSWTPLSVILHDNLSGIAVRLSVYRLVRGRDRGTTRRFGRPILRTRMLFRPQRLRFSVPPLAPGLYSIRGNRQLPSMHAILVVVLRR